MSLRRRVHINLIKIVLIYLALFGALALLVNYDLSARTPWILNPTLSKILGWLAALYGVFWVVWWWFWSAVEGGEETIDLYGVSWAPLTGGFCKTGPFEWCRYPLAFGAIEFIWGLGFLVQSTTAVIKAVPIAALVMVAYLWLFPERRKLAQYGDDYRQYRKGTPLFIPRVPNSSAILHILSRRKRR